jgi:hypothetical protein
MISKRTKRIWIFNFNKYHIQTMQTPYWKFGSLCDLRGPEAGKTHVSPFKIPWRSELHWKCLPRLSEANATTWLICCRNPGSPSYILPPIAVFSSEWRLVWPLPLVCCLPEAGLASQQGQPSEQGVSVQGGCRRRVDWVCGCVGVGGWGRGGGQLSSKALQLLQQVWLVWGAQRQLCFSRQ